MVSQASAGATQCSSWHQAAQATGVRGPGSILCNAIHQQLAVSGGDNSIMETCKPRQRKANVELSAAAAVCGEDYRKQLEVVTLENSRVVEELFLNESGK